jgi:hypothetical protein
MEEAGYWVIVRSIQNKLEMEKEIRSFKKLLETEQILGVMGINAYRAGAVMQISVRSMDVGGYYVVVLAEFIFMEDKRKAIVDACENADYIISLS